MGGTAIIAVTKKGAELAGKLCSSYPGGADVYLPAGLASGIKGAKSIRGGLAGHTGRLFGTRDALVFIMAAGIVVRLIAPHVRDKRTDPAVVVMDEAGANVISLLSGHAGGANRLAETIAAITGGRAVITTASDVQGLIAVDTLAEELGCAVEDWEAAKRVSAALVNGEPVSVCHYNGPEHLAGVAAKFPKSVSVLTSVDDVAMSRAASIIISPFTVDAVDSRKFPVAVLRPRTLVVGIGCNRGTSARKIAWLYDRTLRRHGLSPLSVRNLATITDKRDEAGLIEFAKGRGLKVEFVSKARLRQAGTPSGPSEAVYRNMGVYGVCEPAAMVSAGAKRLIVEKKKTKDVTVAVAEVGG